MENDSLVKEITERVIAETQKQILADVKEAVARFDIKSAINEQVKQHLSSSVQNMTFPDRSIPSTAISFKDFKFSGDVVKGGIVENFGSTGIEDLATKIQMTLLDHAVTFESSLMAPTAVIKGKLTVEGDLVVLGNIDKESSIVNTVADVAVDKIRNNSDLLNIHSDIILSNISNSGLDLNKITQDGKDIISGNRLGYHITDSNLQRVGSLRDLQTQGETLLSDTLYVTTRRVGINSIDPSAALAVWDEEVEIVTSKYSKDTGYIGTQRLQALVLGSNNKDNIVLNTDGSVEVENIRIGNVPMSSATAAPNYNAITGTIVWNENPGHGGAVGWICLGGTQWAKFGIIQ